MPPLRWGKTLADETALMHALCVDRDEPFDPTKTTTRVYAPCCGRVVLADVVIDLREISGTVIRGGNHREPKDHDWACDGCIHILYRDPENTWTQSKLMEAQGAPLALVHEVRADEHMREIEHEWYASGKTDFEPSLVADGARRALEIDHRLASEASRATE